MNESPRLKNAVDAINREKWNLRSPISGDIDSIRIIIDAFLDILLEIHGRLEIMSLTEDDRWTKHLKHRHHVDVPTIDDLAEKKKRKRP